MLVRCVLVIAALLVSACGSPPIKETLDPAARQSVLERLDQFRVTGGLGVWTEQESISTRIDWQQSGNLFSVLIELPAGLSNVRVSQKDRVATIQRSGAEPVVGQSAAILLQQELGLGAAVPIEQMSLWIKGLPGQRAESVTYDNQNRLEKMNYRDAQGTLWRAKILKYKLFDGVYVPATISATGGPYNVRLVLKEWNKKTQLDKPEQGSTAQKGTARGRLNVPGR